MKDSISFIACSRANPGVEHLKTAVIEWCRACNHSVWASPSTLDMLRLHKGSRLLCTECMEQAIVKDPTYEMLPPTDEQLEELADHLASHKPQ